MNKLWYVYVKLSERSFLSKHVQKNKTPLIVDFVLDPFSTLVRIRTQNDKGNIYLPLRTMKRKHAH